MKFLAPYLIRLIFKILNVSLSLFSSLTPPVNLDKSKLILKELLVIINELKSCILFSIRYLLHNTKRALLLDQVTCTNKSCVLLGNGPSLTRDLNCLNNIKNNLDFFCVNFFANTPEFESFKPKHYVLADPLFWTSHDNDNFSNNRDLLFKNVSIKTTWTLFLYLPDAAREYQVENIIQNTNVTIIYFSTRNFNLPSDLIHKFYDIEFCMPLCQNVLIGGIFIALRLNYKNIFIFGSDHSWHESIEIGSNNELLTTYSHFYANEKTLRPFAYRGSELDTWNISRFFSTLAIMFGEYYKLRKYADSINSEIFNVSSNSYIDAFKRVNCDDIKNLAQ